MKKIINIGGKDYTMKSSAFTQFAYKNETGRSLLGDLKLLIQNTDKLNRENFDLESLDNLSELLLRISYVMIQEGDKTQVTDYESFLRNIDSLYDDITWIEDIIELGITPISGQLSKNK